jgi:excisionase family DNA binding protein
MENAGAQLNVPAAARRLGFTLKYVYDLVYAGRLQATKVAGRWQIPEAAIDARMKRKEQQK